MRTYARALAAALILTLVTVMLPGCADKGREYVIYTADERAPFSFADPETGARTGLDIDLLAAIAEDQGFRYVIKTERAGRLTSSVTGGQADALLAGMAIKHELLEALDFSKGYFENGLVMVVSDDSETEALEELADSVIACRADTPGAAYAESKAEAYGLELEYYETDAAMYAAVARGRAAACFGDFSAIGWEIKSGGLGLRTAGAVINPAQCGFAVKRGTNSALLDMFNQGLANIKASGKYAEILEKYGF